MPFKKEKNEQSRLALPGNLPPVNAFTALVRFVLILPLPLPSC